MPKDLLTGLSKISKLKPMSLVFAGITPHPPLLIPNIGKEKTDLVKETRQALDTLEQKLYTSRPDIIMIISPHTGLFENAFSVNAHNQFTSDFGEFGDLVTKKTWIGSPGLAAKIAHAGNTHGINIRLISDETIDHGAAVPLYFLTDHLEEVKILPLGYSGFNRETHINYGVLLKELIMKSEKRIAVIASGDLSHNSNKSSSELDQTLIELFEKRELEEIMNLDQDLIEQANECGYRSILILLGIVKNMNFKFEKLCYQAPLGVGYLTANFDI